MKLAVIEKFLDKADQLTSAIQNLDTPDVVIIGGGGNENGVMGGSAILSSYLDKIVKQIGNVNIKTAVAPPLPPPTQ